jgi:hypothetical protein
MLLALASAVILGSESRGTRDHILLSQIRDFLRLAGLRWRYSPPPPHGYRSTCGEHPIIFDANYSLEINSFHVMNDISRSAITIIPYPNIFGV